MDSKLVSQITTQLKIVARPHGVTGGLAMQDALRRLDEIAEMRADELEPQLLHFLKNRSYRKALAYLEPEE